ncbi:MAG: DUF3370 domain-containing protein [Plectolyngbya sp. WJT66-NPBG17]|jgi:hypothetical protein|nr:DUF3370 domain-containing protein [Plectolyngbya sp. WJT66-NPBG17]MBW4527370.1 DUF3370 domain-containing protein [Phormidium tanganyikae FI6-MK23]
MFPFLPISPLAQLAPRVPILPPPIVAPQPTNQETLPPQENVPPQEFIEAQEIRVLPGKLDDIPVFNSNSPEVVLTEGILLSTFPSQGMRVPAAHLNYAFNGRFDIFAHHISRASNPSQTRSLFQGIVVYNPNDRPVQIDVSQAATYLTRPDALFIDLPAYVEDPLGTVFAGPGSRVVSDILRGRRQGNLPTLMVIPPKQAQMLMNLPIPAGTVTPTSNGRSTLMRLASNAPVYVATLAMFAPLNPNRTERVPTIEEWLNLLVNAGVAGPRDIPPSPPNSKSTSITYGRVAGVSKGSEWRTQITDNRQDYLSIPNPGRAFSYGLSTLEQGTFATGQIQSAPMLVRYPDTAYLANGNYAIHYGLTLPLRNTTRQNQTISLSIETPIKQDRSRNELVFLSPPDLRIFFRGTVRLRYLDDRSILQTRFIHLVQRRGQKGDSLLNLTLPPNATRSVEVDFLYPPDATPPQVLTVRTLSNSINR